MMFLPSRLLYELNLYPLKFCLVRLNVQIWEHMIYVLHMNSRGDNGVLFWFTWYMLWQSTCGFPRWYWGSLCVGVDACFYYLFSDRNFGSPCSSLHGLNIMIMKLFDAYCRINSQILVVTLEYLGDIRVGWYVSYGVILVWSLDSIDQKE